MKTPIENLQIVKYKDIPVFAVTGYKFGFSNQSAESEYVFGDTLIKPMGKSAKTHDFTIVFSEYINKGDFTGIYGLFEKACEDPTPGKLVTPDRILTATCSKFEAEYSPTNPGGVTINVTFTDIGEKSEYKASKSISELKSMENKVRERVELDNEDDSTIWDTLDDINQLVNQIDEMPDRYSLLAKTRLESLKDKSRNIAEKSKGISDWQRMLLIMQLTEATEESIAANSDDETNKRVYVVQDTIPVSALPGLTGAKIDDLYSKNPQLGKSPMVDVGEVILL